MDSDKRSKIEVLLRMLLAAQTEVHFVHGQRETGGASREAVTRLENAHDGLQEVIDDLEGAAGTSHRHVKHHVTRHEDRHRHAKTVLLSRHAARPETTPPAFARRPNP
jgi:predicted phage gp36 major capsid-like protein